MPFDRVYIPGRAAGGGEREGGVGGGGGGGVRERERERELSDVNTFLTSPISLHCLHATVALCVVLLCCLFLSVRAHLLMIHLVKME